MTDAEKFVRESCPLATIHGPMLNGKIHPYGRYVIYAAPWMSGPLASGKTPIEAWANAANRIEKSGDGR